MRFSDARGHQVVSTTTAESVGKVKDLVVDFDARRVHALTLRKTPGDGDTLLWTQLSGFGADAVTTSGPETIVEADDHTQQLAAKDRRLVKKRVLSTLGDDLGAVSDVEFDPATGAVTGLVLPSETVPADRFVGLGSYAVVVAAEPA